MKFLQEFEKKMSKIDTVSSDNSPPRYWFSSGNHILNYILSGDLYGAVPQGKITGIAGPSGAGKSFIQCNIVREAQKDGAFVLMIDTEGALDTNFVEAIGIDTSNNYNYKSPDKI
jgi:RecA/RadA recombinase